MKLHAAAIATARTDVRDGLYTLMSCCVLNIQHGPVDSSDAAVDRTLLDTSPSENRERLFEYHCTSIKV